VVGSLDNLAIDRQPPPSQINFVIDGNNINSYISLESLIAMLLDLRYVTHSLIVFNSCLILVLGTAPRKSKNNQTYRTPKK